MPAPARRQAGIAVMSRPSKRTLPALGRSRPQIMPTSVVLPAPFGPITARTSPGSTAMETSSTALRPPNRRPSPSVSSSGAVTEAILGAI